MRKKYDANRSNVIAIGLGRDKVSYDYVNAMQSWGVLDRYYAKFDGERTSPQNFFSIRAVLPVFRKEIFLVPMVVCTPSNTNNLLSNDNNNLIDIVYGVTETVPRV